jgi:soluble lytic murein transglycosylase-like protein
MRAHKLFAALLTAAILFGYAPAQAQIAAEQAQPRAVDIASQVAEAAQRFGIPESWIYAVMRTESAGRIGAVSSAGAMGLMQLMPGTWDRQRTRYGLGSDPFDPRDNILAGTSYLRELHDSYGASGFLAAYNAGPGRYEDWRDHGRSLPAETRSYVAKIASMLQSASAPTVVSRAVTVQPVRLSWTQSQLFAVRGDADDSASDSFVTAAPPPSNLAPARPLNGLFVPVSGSRSQ